MNRHNPPPRPPGPPLKEGWAARNARQKAEEAARQANGAEAPIDDRAAKAAEDWAGAMPAEGTIAELYWRARGFQGPLPKSFRFHPNCEGQGPALVVAAGHPSLDDENAWQAPQHVTAVQRIYLKPDGSGRLDKKHRGPIKGQPLVVRVEPDCGTIVIGEGIEKTMAAAQALGVNGWAAGGINFIDDLAEGLPAFIDRVILMQDRKPADAPARMKAAAQIFLAKGIAVSILEPPDAPHDDWDELVAAGLEWEVIFAALELKTKPVLKPEPLYRELTAVRWGALKLPPRDWLIEGLLCTTSRWMMIGQAGVGKTLIGLDLGNAIAHGAKFADWPVVAPRRVMCLDGELPAETMKERLDVSAKVYGRNENLVVYNRDLIPRDALAPLNTPDGQQWLLQEVEGFRPDLIIFDAVRYLTSIDLLKPEDWAPVRELIHVLMSRRIAQVWMHHTGRDATKGYGDSSREWDLDTVAKLTKPPDCEGDDDAIGRVVLDFDTKARLRTKATGRLYRNVMLQRDDVLGWQVEGPAKLHRPIPQNELEKQRVLIAYNALAEDAKPEPGETSKLVRKVLIRAIHDEMSRRGWLDRDDKGRLTSSARSAWKRGKDAWERERKIVISGDFLWWI